MRKSNSILLILGCLLICQQEVLPQDNVVLVHDTVDEFQVYFQWLQENPRDSTFATVFQKALQNITHLEDAKLLQSELFFYLNTPQKEELLHLLAEFSERISDYEGARQYYTMLLDLNGKAEYRIKRAIQSVLLGEYERALDELDLQYFDEGTKNSSLVYQLYVFAFLGRLDSIASFVDSIKLTDLSTGELIALWELAQQIEDATLQSRIDEVLALRDDSALLSFVTDHKKLDQVNIFPNPLLLLSLSSGTSQIIPSDNILGRTQEAEDTALPIETTGMIPYGIQLGSFRDVSNAVAYVVSAQERYQPLHIYETKLESGIVYRIYAENAQGLSAEEFIITLKSKQLEGVIHMNKPEDAILVDPTR